MALLKPTSSAGFRTRTWYLGGEGCAVEASGTRARMIRHDMRVAELKTQPKSHGESPNAKTSKPRNPSAFEPSSNHVASLQSRGRDFRQEPGLSRLEDQNVLRLQLLVDQRLQEPMQVPSILSLLGFREKGLPSIPTSKGGSGVSRTLWALRGSTA